MMLMSLWNLFNSIEYFELSDYLMCKQYYNNLYLNLNRIYTAPPHNNPTKHDSTNLNTQTHDNSWLIKQKFKKYNYHIKAGVASEWAMSFRG